MSKLSLKHSKHSGYAPVSGDFLYISFFLTLFCAKFFMSGGYPNILNRIGVSMFTCFNLPTPFRFKGNLKQRNINYDKRITDF